LLPRYPATFQAANLDQVLVAKFFDSNSCDRGRVRSGVAAYDLLCELSQTRTLGARTPNHCGDVGQAMRNIRPLVVDQELVAELFDD